MKSDALHEPTDQADRLRQARRKQKSKAHGRPPDRSDLPERDDPPDYIAEPPALLEEVHQLFRRWLSNGYDTDKIDAVLAAAAAHAMGGDPLWLLVISGPGAAKTETVQSLAGAGVPGVASASASAAMTPRSRLTISIFA